MKQWKCNQTQQKIMQINQFTDWFDIWYFVAQHAGQYQLYSNNMVLLLLFVALLHSIIIILNDQSMLRTFNATQFVSVRYRVCEFSITFVIVSTFFQHLQRRQSTILFQLLFRSRRKIIQRAQLLRSSVWFVVKKNSLSVIQSKNALLFIYIINTRTISRAGNKKINISIFHMTVWNSNRF